MGIEADRADRNFNDLINKFEDHIYGTLKGTIRQAVLWEDLSGVLTQLPPAPLRIIDAGAGLGQLALRFAELGHQLIVCDISEKMLQRAQLAAEQAGVLRQMQFIQQPLQQLPQVVKQPVDLVLCHAVLEWLADPVSALQPLSDCLRPGGILSLMFYNAHGLLFRNLLLGNIHPQRLTTTQRRCSGSLQPPHPLTGEQIDHWLTALSLTTLTKSGVRVFSDYWQPSVQQSFDPQAIVALEQHYCRQPAFVSLGRYLHYLVQKPLRQLSRVGIRGVDESSG